MTHRYPGLAEICIEKSAVPIVPLFILLHNRMDIVSRGENIELTQQVSQSHGG